MVVGIDNIVLQNVPPQLYEAYHETAMQHFNQKINLRQFRERLETIFRSHPQIIDTLSIFFSESPKNGADLS